MSEDDLKRVQMDEAWAAHLEQKARERGDEPYTPPHRGSASWFNATKPKAPTEPKPTPAARQPKHAGEKPVPIENRPAEVVGARCYWQACFYNKFGKIIACLDDGIAKVRFDDQRVMRIPFQFLSVPPAESVAT